MESKIYRSEKISRNLGPSSSKNIVLFRNKSQKLDLESIKKEDTSTPITYREYKEVEVMELEEAPRRLEPTHCLFTYTFDLIKPCPYIISPSDLVSHNKLSKKFHCV